MAQSSFPFENIDTTETQYSQLFRTLNNGVNGTPDGGELEVDSAAAGLAVDIAAGQAMVRGHFYISTAVETRSLAVADPSDDRIDLIVLRLDPIANSVVLAVKTGVPDPAPVAPTLVLTDGGIFEQPLAEVLVPANAGVPSTITDRREFMGTKLGSWTTAGRPIVTDRALFGFNTDLQAIEFYNPTTDEWEEITPASIGDIGDVTITTPADGELLAYDNGASEWVNQALTATQMPAGSIIAVKHAIFTGIQDASVTAGNNVAVTDLSITHEVANSSNKLIISAFFGALGDSSDFARGGIAVHDGTGLIGVADEAGIRTLVSSGGIPSGTSGAFVVSKPSIQFVHTPGAGSKTYTVRAINIDTSTNTMFINRTRADANVLAAPRTVSSLVIQEVAV